jgi:hypothetical protein
MTAKTTRCRVLALMLVTLMVPAAFAKPAIAAANALQPSRLLDTRGSVGGHSGRLQAGEVFGLAVVPVAPATASAVALNVTAVNPTASGFLSVWPCGGSEPSTSNLNFASGQTVANSTIVGVGSAGTVCFRATVATDIVVDVSAWFDASSPLVATAPARLVDTRDGLGFERRRLRSGEVLNVPIRGRGGVPADARSAVVNLTATAPTATGFLTAFPCDQAAPNTSNVNFERNRSVPNATVVALDSKGSFCVTTSAETYVLVDLMGSLRGDDAVSLQPQRLVDTRSGIGTPSGPVAAPLATRVVPVAGRNGVPGGSGLAILNVTTTDATTDGFVTAYPCDRPIPSTSNLNMIARSNVANLVVVPVANDGTVCVRATSYAGGSVHLIVDVTGWLAAASLPKLVPSHFATLPLGQPLPSGADCATLVRPTPENKPANTAKNLVRVSPPTLPSPALFQRVDGNFSGTTDEIMQWAACKWGVDEDIVKAMAANESRWNDRALGDFTSDRSLCADEHPLGVDGVAGQCPQSLGFMQLKWRYHQAAHPATAQSNAYHLDYAFAVWRSCYEGNLTFLNRSGYKAGDVLGCIGNWHAGDWKSPSGQIYVDRVMTFVAERPWEKPEFTNT